MSDVLSWVRFVLTAVLTVGGVFLFLTGVVGQYRFDYVLNRMHAASLGDSFGLLLMAAGLSVSANDGWLIVKLLITALFLWVTSPTASHLIARLEITTQDEPEKHMEVQRK